MRIIIAGMGDVGYHLAKELSNESHDIIAIDKNQQRLSRINSMTDILTITGSSTSLAILKEAKTLGYNYNLLNKKKLFFEELYVYEFKLKDDKI